MSAHQGEHRHVDAAQCVCSRARHLVPLIVRAAEGLSLPARDGPAQPADAAHVADGPAAVEAVHFGVLPAQQAHTGRARFRHHLLPRVHRAAQSRLPAADGGDERRLDVASLHAAEEPRVESGAHALVAE